MLQCDEDGHNVQVVEPARAGLEGFGGDLLVQVRDVGYVHCARDGRVDMLVHGVALHGDGAPPTVLVRVRGFAAHMYVMFHEQDAAALGSERAFTDACEAWVRAFCAGIEREACAEDGGMRPREVDALREACGALVMHTEPVERRVFNVRMADETMFSAGKMREMNAVPLQYLEGAQSGVRVDLAHPRLVPVAARVARAMSADRAWRGVLGRTMVCEANIPFARRFIADRGIKMYGVARVVCRDARLLSGGEHEEWEQQGWEHGPPRRVGRHQWEVECDVDAFVPLPADDPRHATPCPMDVAYFDIETMSLYPNEAHAEVYLVSVVLATRFGPAHEEAVRRVVNIVRAEGDVARGLHAPPPMYGERHELVVVPTEADVIREFCRVVCDFDPFVISGYNVLGFDLPYLAMRARALDIEDDTMGALGMLRGRRVPWRDNVLLPQHERDDSEEAVLSEASLLDVPVAGRSIVDLLRYFKSDVSLRSLLEKAGGLSLNAVCAMILGELEQKDEIDLRDTPKMRATADGLQRLVNYCARDAFLVYRLDTSPKNVLGTLSTLCRVNDVTLQDQTVKGLGQRLMVLLLRELRANGTVLETGAPVDVQQERLSQEKNYGGGFVRLPPGVGMYLDKHSSLVVWDFKSMYPMLMLSFNLCATTIAPVGALRKQGLVPHVDFFQPDARYDFAVVRPHVRESILCRLTSALIANRAKYRREEERHASALVALEAIGTAVGDAATWDDAAARVSCAAAAKAEALAAAEAAVEAEAPGSQGFKEKQSAAGALRTEHAQLASWRDLVKEGAAVHGNVQDAIAYARAYHRNQHANAVVMQKGFKTCSNSVYGFTGFVLSHVASIMVANATTSMGREDIWMCCQMAQEMWHPDHARRAAFVDACTRATPDAPHMFQDDTERAVVPWADMLGVLQGRDLLAENRTRTVFGIPAGDTDSFFARTDMDVQSLMVNAFEMADLINLFLLCKFLTPRTPLDPALVAAWLQACRDEYASPLVVDGDPLEAVRRERAGGCTPAFLRALAHFMIRRLFRVEIEFEKFLEHALFPANLGTKKGDRFLSKVTQYHIIDEMTGAASAAQRAQHHLGLQLEELHGRKKRYAADNKEGTEKGKVPVGMDSQWCRTFHDVSEETLVGRWGTRVHTPEVRCGALGMRGLQPVRSDCLGLLRLVMTGAIKDFVSRKGRVDTLFLAPLDPDYRPDGSCPDDWISPNHETNGGRHLLPRIVAWEGIVRAVHLTPQLAAAHGLRHTLYLWLPPDRAPRFDLAHPDDTSCVAHEYAWIAMSAADGVQLADEHACALLERVAESTPAEATALFGAAHAAWLEVDSRRPMWVNGMWTVRWLLGEARAVNGVRGFTGHISIQQLLSFTRLSKPLAMYLPASANKNQKKQCDVLHQGWRALCEHEGTGAPRRMEALGDGDARAALHFTNTVLESSDGMTRKRRKYNTTQSVPSHVNFLMRTLGDNLMPYMKVPYVLVASHARALASDRMMEPTEALQRGIDIDVNRMIDTRVKEQMLAIAVPVVRECAGAKFVPHLSALLFDPLPGTQRAKKTIVATTDLAQSMDLDVRRRCRACRVAMDGEPPHNIVCAACGEAGLLAVLVEDLETGAIAHDRWAFYTDTCARCMRVDHFDETMLSQCTNSACTHFFRRRMCHNTHRATVGDTLPKAFRQLGPAALHRLRAHAAHATDRPADIPAARRTLNDRRARRSAVLNAAYAAHRAMVTTVVPRIRGAVKRVRAASKNIESFFRAPVASRDTVQLARDLAEFVPDVEVPSNPRTLCRCAEEAAARMESGTGITMMVPPAALQDLLHRWDGASAHTYDGTPAHQWRALQDEMDAAVQDAHTQWHQALFNQVAFLMHKHAHMVEETGKSEWSW